MDNLIRTTEGPKKWTRFSECGIILGVLLSPTSERHGIRFHVIFPELSGIPFGFQLCDVDGAVYHITNNIAAVFADSSFLCSVYKLFRMEKPL